MSKSLSSNSKYCLVFLWNGGEMLRAMALCRELTGQSLAQCRRTMNDLAENYGKNIRKLRMEDRQMRDRLNAENPCNPPV